MDSRLRGNDDDGRRPTHDYRKNVVGVEEVESPACPLGGGRSIQLSYTPTHRMLYRSEPRLPSIA